MTQAQASDAGGVAAAVIDLVRGNGAVAGAIQLKRQVLADGHRRDRIDDRHRGGAGRAVAVVISDGEGDDVGADVGDIKAALVQAQAGNAAGVAAAIVDLGRGDRGVTAGIQLNGQIGADGHRRD